MSILVLLLYSGQAWGKDRRTKQDTGRIITAIEAKLTEYPGDEDLANGDCWL